MDCWWEPLKSILDAVFAPKRLVKKLESKKCKKCFISTSMDPLKKDITFESLLSEIIFWSWIQHIAVMEGNNHFLILCKFVSFLIR